MQTSDRLAQYQQEKARLEQDLALLQQRQQDLSQQYLKVLGAIEALESVVIAHPVAVDGIQVPSGN